MKKYLFFLFILYSGNLMACSCVTPSFMSLYYQSDFIAKAKILKVTPAGNNSEFNEITIQIIELYKGEMITSIKAVSYLKDGYGIVLTENSTWLLFANINAQGTLRFDYCSGSEQIDKEFDLVHYPKLKQRFEKWLDRTIDLLHFLKKEKLAQTNEFSLGIKYALPDKENLEGYVVSKQTFAIYELTVLKDMNVKK